MAMVLARRILNIVSVSAAAPGAAKTARRRATVSNARMSRPSYHARPLAHPRADTEPSATYATSRGVIRARCPGADEAVTRHRLDGIGEVRRGVELGDALGAAQVVAHGMAALDHLSEERLEVTRARLDRALMKHAAHAHLVASERDVPEPSLREIVDADVSLLAPRE